MLDTRLVVRRIQDVLGDDVLAGVDTSGTKAFSVFHRLAKERPEVRDRLIGFPMHSPGAGSAYNGGDVGYMLGGLWHANVIAKAIARHAPDRSLDILDFGCGIGRILRFLLSFLPQHRYAGCEVNRASIDWLRETFSPAEFHAILPEPPTSYADAAFEVTYGWSIFTHFNERLHLAWLRELHRIVKPGGLVMVTVHNEALVQRYGSEARLMQKMQERAVSYDDVIEDYRDRGFAYWVSYPEEARKVGIDIDTFGMAFISRDYIRREWSALFEVVEFVADADPNWQDLVVLRRK